MMKETTAVANGHFEVRKPTNEPALTYAPGSPEKAALRKKLKEIKETQIEIPLIIGGKEVRTGNTGVCVMPHNKKHVLAVFHKAGPNEIRAAIDAALAARREWEELPWENRAAIFLKAAQLVSGPWRSTLNAGTMLGQSKTALMAETDACVKLTDYLRFNPYFVDEVYREQPFSTADAFNRVEYRPLEGFVCAISPFNSVAGAANLALAPAIAGNVVVWKPASTAVYSAYQVMQVLQRAGLPGGVINFIPGSGSEVGEVVFSNEWFAGLHFTGSTSTFQDMWLTIARNLKNLRTYPKLVGETGGKDFLVAHRSADVEPLVTALVRGSFGYCGQLCSATSRAYIPESTWPTVRKRLVDEVEAIKVGDVEDFTNYMGAVIDQNAFNTIRSYIEYAKNSPEAEVLCGGRCDDSTGYFIRPTVVVTTNPKFKTMVEEIFGPVLTIFVYRDSEFEQTLDLVNETSPYALTGGIFSQCRQAIALAERKLKNAAGNFYINDMTLSSVVGQQPFSGARASGTNDKIGGKWNLMRWMSPRSIKELFNPPASYRYPFMAES